MVGEIGDAWWATDAFVRGLGTKVIHERGGTLTVGADTWHLVPAGEPVQDEIVVAPGVAPARRDALIADLMSGRGDGPRYLSFALIDGEQPSADVPGYRATVQEPVMWRATDVAAPALPRGYHWTTLTEAADLGALAELTVWPVTSLRPSDHVVTTFVVRDDSEAVCYGQLVVAQDVAYLADLFVHPDHRGRGLARALLQVRLRAARERGLTAAVLAASEAGRPVFEALGFETACRLDVRHRVVADTQATSEPEVR